MIMPKPSIIFCMFCTVIADKETFLWNKRNKTQYFICLTYLQLCYFFLRILVQATCIFLEIQTCSIDRTCKYSAVKTLLGSYIGKLDFGQLCVAFNVKILYCRFVRWRQWFWLWVEEDWTLPWLETCLTSQGRYNWRTAVSTTYQHMLSTSPISTMTRKVRDCFLVSLIKFDKLMTQVTPMGCVGFLVPNPLVSTFSAFDEKFNIQKFLYYDAPVSYRFLS